MPTFSNEWLDIRTLANGLINITIAPGYSWDGCTLAPDLPGTYAGGALHDALYQFVDEIVKAWPGWTVLRVLRLADAIFFERMIADGAGRFVAMIYTGAVRIVGYPFNRLMRLFRRHPK